MSKKTSTLDLVLSVIPYVLSLVLVVFLFLPVVKNGNDTISAMDLTFGKTTTVLGQKGGYNFNTLLVLTFILPLALALVVVALNLAKVNGLAKLIGFFLPIAFVVSVIGLATILNVEFVTSGLIKSKTSLDALGFELSVQGIIALVVAILGAISSVAYIVTSASKKN